MEAMQRMQGGKVCGAREQWSGEWREVVSPPPPVSRGIPVGQPGED